jgi:SAM-dependent methyltransferase
LGPLPAVGFFAGKALAHPLPGGELLRCRRCDLRFRWPLLADYRSLYNNETADTWSGGPMRRDQRLVHDVLDRRPGSCRVLDFGCYSGDFLARLPARFERFGVEVSAAAAAMARSRAGAQVTATLDDLPQGLCFDAIVSMDVLEHVPSPRSLLQQLLSRLKPGGLLVITTGDGGNALWRLVGARWWYCYFPEHIAFISRRWLQYHVPRLGGTFERIETFSYLDDTHRDAARRWRHWLKYLLRPARHEFKRARQAEELGSDMGVPGIGLVRDHVLVQLTRTPASTDGDAVAHVGR